MTEFPTVPLKMLSNAICWHPWPIFPAWSPWAWAAFNVNRLNKCCPAEWSGCPHSATKLKRKALNKSCFLLARVLHEGQSWWQSNCLQCSSTETIGLALEQLVASWHTSWLYSEQHKRRMKTTLPDKETFLGDLVLGEQNWGFNLCSCNRTLRNMPSIYVTGSM